VLIVRWEVADVLPGLTEAGENEQLEAAGCPEQLRGMGEAKVPPNAWAVTV